ncbi:glycosyltransferase [Pleomorphomonas sp. PLEO]|uniref:glycosyltransferase n=1 Tax=Pleomorphomonas sp. PLEO TaxID=3239306 RepID=UPI00351DFEA4
MHLMLTQCFPPKFGGIENMMGGLAETIAASGAELLVLADGEPDPSAAPGYRIRRYRGFKPLRRWLKAKAAERVVRAGKVDTVFADSWKSLERFQPSGCQVICLAHGMEFPPKPTAAKAARISVALAKASRVIANSRYTASLAAPYVDARRLSVVTPPIQPQPTADPIAVAEFANRFGPGPIIASLCRLEPRKGIDRLIEAMSAHPALAAARLLIAGDGPDRARLEEIARSSPAAGNIHFLGRIDDRDKAALFTVCDVFAMPSRREGASVEGFGIVYLEAGWYGKPSLGGTDGGAADAIKDGETGLLCDGAKGEQVASALARLLSDADLRTRLGTAAQIHARSQTWAQKLGEYLPSPAAEVMDLPATTGLKDSMSSPPRILQLLPALGDGGVERSTVEMVGYLRDKGIVNFVASGGGDLVTAVEAGGAKHLAIPVGRKAPWSIIGNAFAVAKLIDREAIDIVHARSRAPAWAGWLATRFARRPCRFLTTFHGVYGHGNALKRLYNRVMLRGPLVVANSQFIRDHIETIYGYPADRIVVAARGIEPALFDPAHVTDDQRAAIRHEFGMVDGEPILIMVGRVTGWKGHAVLVDALARQADRPWRLVLVGSGNDGVIADLKARIDGHGLSQRIILTGSRRDVPILLAAADLAFSASTRPEAFGRAAIEAEAMQTPVIATDHGGSRETVLPGRTGWLVAPGDADAMAAAIGEALSAPERLKEMGRAGRAFVMENYTTARMLEQEFSAYRRLMDTAP